MDSDFAEAHRAFAAISAEAENPRPTTDVARLLQTLNEIQGMLFVGAGPQKQSDLLLARRLLEVSAMLCASAGRLQELSAYLSQLESFYSRMPELPPSESEGMLRGLRLLTLLSANRIPEFYTEVESLPQQFLSNHHIKYVLELAQLIREGSFHKVWQLRDSAPSQLYSFFFSKLAETFRDEVAQCLTASYSELRVEDAKRMLMAPADSDSLLAEISSKYNWKITDGVIHFNAGPQHDASKELPALPLMSQLFYYAKEYERIV